MVNTHCFKCMSIYCICHLIANDDIPSQDNGSHDGPGDLFLAPNQGDKPEMVGEALEPLEVDPPSFVNPREFHLRGFGGHDPFTGQGQPQQQPQQPHGNGLCVGGPQVQDFAPTGASIFPLADYNGYMPAQAGSAALAAPMPPQQPAAAPAPKKRGRPAGSLDKVKRNAKGQGLAKKPVFRTSGRPNKAQREAYEEYKNLFKVIEQMEKNLQFVEPAKYERLAYLAQKAGLKESK